MSQITSCQNRKIALNRYSHEPYLQNCGKCFNCLLQKRNQYLHRLFSEISKKYLHSYFITLTFNDDSIYYVDSILKKNNDPLLPPYSYSLFFTPEQLNKLKIDFNHDYVDELSSNYSIDSSMNFRYSLDDKDFNHLFGTKNNSLHLDTLYGNKKIKFNKANIYHFRTAFAPFRSVQLFLKRFRKNFTKFCLSRKTEVSPLLYFCCQEYGPNTLRPHFHLLIFTNSLVFPNFITQSCKKFGQRKNIYTLDSWKFGFSDVQRINVEEKVSTYIAGYINSFQILPSTHVVTNLFKTKHSHSLLLGFRGDIFNKVIDFFREYNALFHSQSLTPFNYKESMLNNYVLDQFTNFNKSDLQKYFPRVFSRVYRQFPFQFLSISKYNDSVIKEILTTKYSTFSDVHKFHSMNIVNTQFFKYYTRFINFHLENFEKLKYNTFKSKSFLNFYTKSTGDVDIPNFTSSADAKCVYVSYLTSRFRSIWRKYALMLHYSFRLIFGLKYDIDNIQRFINIQYFVNELRNKILLNNWYSKLQEYQSIEHADFNDIAPLFYPVDFDRNRYTDNLTNYVNNLIFDYTKHRFHEPKYQ